MEKKIEVKTNAGTICARESEDPGAPGIYLYFVPKGSDVEIDLACAEVKEDDEYRHDGETAEDIALYIYEDIRTVCCTERIDYKRSDVVDALIDWGCDDIKENEE